MAYWSAINEDWMQRQPEIINEILESLYERGFYGREEPTYYGTDEGQKEIVNSHQLWRSLQDALTPSSLVAWGNDQFAGRLTPIRENARQRYARYHDDAIVLGRYTNDDLYEDAGLFSGESKGFRRATAYDPTVNDWTDKDDPMYSRGKAVVGDILGPWIVEDIRAVVEKLIYMCIDASNTSTGYGPEEIWHLDYQSKRWYGAYLGAVNSPAKTESNWNAGISAAESDWSLLLDWLDTTPRGPYVSFFYDWRFPWSGDERLRITGDSRAIKLYVKDEDSRIENWSFPTDIQNIKDVFLYSRGSYTKGNEAPEESLYDEVVHHQIKLVDTAVINGSAEDIAIDAVWAGIDQFPYYPPFSSEMWESDTYGWDAALFCVLKINPSYETPE